MCPNCALATRFLARPLRIPLSDRGLAPNRRTRHMPVGLRHPIPSHPRSDGGLADTKEPRNFPYCQPAGSEGFRHSLTLA